MDFARVAEAILKILRPVVAIAAAAFLLYLRIRVYHKPKDLGDGGIQKLFPDNY
jgi:hypothetical protein